MYVIVIRCPKIANEIAGVTFRNISTLFRTNASFLPNTRGLCVPEERNEVCRVHTSRRPARRTFTSLGRVYANFRIFTARPYFNVYNYRNFESERQQSTPSESKFKSVYKNTRHLRRPNVSMNSVRVAVLKLNVSRAFAKIFLFLIVF